MRERLNRKCDVCLASVMDSSPCLGCFACDGGGGRGGAAHAVRTEFFERVGFMLYRDICGRGWPGRGSVGRSYKCGV